jgi:alanine-glyoxylate transaminase/serine-glyoxylate transaminase/serine-pyruvate transaminase
LLQDALPDLGFRAFATDRRLPQLTSVWLPEGVDDAKTRAELRNRFGIEVGGGLGELAGKGWRIGLMGHSARERSVTTLLGALRTLL